MQKDNGLAHRLTDVALALHAIGSDSCPCPRKPMLCQYLVLLHSPDTCSSSSSGSDAMRMRVLAAFAAARPSLQDLLLKETLRRLFSFIIPPPAFSRVYALAACHRATPWTPVMRELPLALPLRPWGIIACIHRCRNATRSSVHDSGATPSLTTSRHLLSTLQISLCRPVLRHPPNAAFFEAIFW